MISTGGVLAAGLGGVALTHRARSGVRNGRPSGSARSSASCNADRLIPSWVPLRYGGDECRLQASRHWPDMNLKLTEIQEYAAAFNQRAWTVALDSRRP